MEHNECHYLVFLSVCPEWREEQAATGTSGWSQAEAPADPSESRDPAWDRGPACPESGCSQQSTLYPTDQTTCRVAPVLIVTLRFSSFCSLLNIVLGMFKIQFFLQIFNMQIFHNSYNVEWMKMFVVFNSADTAITGYCNILSLIDEMAPCFDHLGYPWWVPYEILDTQREQWNKMENQKYRFSQIRCRRWTKQERCKGPRRLPDR